MARGIYGKDLIFMIDGIEYKCDIKNAVISHEISDDDDVTFCETGGNQNAVLTITAIQSTEPDSLWSFIWDHSGEEIDFKLAPHANEVPSTTQPHFTGLVRVPARPDIGGQAGRTNRYEFESEFEIIGEVAKVTTAGAGD